MRVSRTIFFDFAEHMVTKFKNPLLYHFHLKKHPNTGFWSWMRTLKYSVWRKNLSWVKQVHVMQYVFFCIVWYKMTFQYYLSLILESISLMCCPRFAVSLLLLVFKNLTSAFGHFSQWEEGRVYIYLSCSIMLCFLM